MALCVQISIKYPIFMVFSKIIDIMTCEKTQKDIYISWTAAAFSLTLNPLTPHEAIKASFRISKEWLNFLKPVVLEQNFHWTVLKIPVYCFHLSFFHFYSNLT